VWAGAVRIGDGSSEDARRRWKLEAMQQELVERVHALVCEQLGVDRGDVRPDANILDDLGADSLDVVELVMAIEEAFDLEIPDEDVEVMRTIADVETYVSKRIAA